ncbi:MAG: hypothetical protein E5V37_18515 [Mesorhizobium sp.]|nr:MAG: hypothetical protein E5V37_18515 [Mesorhizobium sp.]
MASDDDLPVFPMELVSSMRRSSFRYIYHRDLVGDGGIEELLDLCWRSPETKNYIFWECDGFLDNRVQRSLDSGELAFFEIQRKWYRHPKYKNDYVRLVGAPEFEWEQTAQATPEYFRGEATLTSEERRRRDHKALAQEIATANAAGSAPFGGRLGHHFVKYATIYTIAGVIVTIVSILLTL